MAVYWDGDASIDNAQKAVSRDAKRAMQKSAKQKLAEKLPRRNPPEGVPKRGRMMRQVLEVPTSRKERKIRAVVVALLFWIIGSALAFFIAGMPLKGAPRPEQENWVLVAAVIGLCLGVVGGLIGYFIGVKRPVRTKSHEETRGDEE